MPEITVHENGDALFRESYIGASRKRTIMAAKTQSQRTKLTLNNFFQRAIL